MKKTVQLGLLALLSITMVGCGSTGVVDSSTKTSTSQATSNKETDVKTSTNQGVSVKPYVSQEITVEESADNKDATITVKQEKTEEEAAADLSDFEKTNTIPEDAVTVNLSSITSDVYEITKEGSYVLEGTLNGCVKVAVDKQVHLYLKGVEITAKTNAAINITGKKKKVITVVEGTTNTLTDAKSYTSFDNEDGDEPNAAIFCKKALTINGNGTLNIKAQGTFATVEETKQSIGINCKDSLVILDNPKITIDAVGNGIKGKDNLSIFGGTFDITSGNDAIKSDNETDEGMGNVYIYKGTYKINAADDGITSYNDLVIQDGTFDITSGGGAKDSVSRTTYDGSYKGVKSDAGTISLNGGTFKISSLHDAIHSNNDVVINGATIESYTSYASSERMDGKVYIHGHGVHADNAFYFMDGKMDIKSSYEGCEAEKIYVEGGEISLISRDDGFNASSETNTNSNCLLQVDAGSVYINAYGDGLDSNGNIIMNGGVVIVDGPTDGSNGALDSGDGGYTIAINGGYLCAFGASGMMAENPSSNSKQIYASLNITGGAANSYIQFKKGSEEIFSFYSMKAHTGTVSMAVSFPSMVKDVEYTAGYGTNTKTFKGGSSTSNGGFTPGFGGGGFGPRW